MPRSWNAPVTSQSSVHNSTSNTIEEAPLRPDYDGRIWPASMTMDEPHLPPASITTERAPLSGYSSFLSLSGSWVLESIKTSSLLSQLVNSKSEGRRLQAEGGCRWTGVEICSSVRHREFQLLSMTPGHHPTGFSLSVCVSSSLSFVCLFFLMRPLPSKVNLADPQPKQGIFPARSFASCAPQFDRKSQINLAFPQTSLPKLHQQQQTNTSPH